MKKINTMLVLIAGIYSQFSAAGPIETLSEYNLVVLNNLYTTSEVEGKTLVGGDLSGTSNYGTRITQNAIVPETTLIVGGNIAAGTTINANGQTVVVGGTNNGTVNSKALLTNTTTLDFDLVKSEFTNFSGYLSELAVNSTLSSPTTQPGAASFQIGSDVNNGIAVFSIDQADFFGNSKIQQYDVSSTSASTVVINVSGTTINGVNALNPVGSFNNSSFYSNVIWNFYEATSITLNTLFQGSLIAPFADLTSSTPIQGSVIVNNYYQNGEVHLPSFNGTIDYDASTVITTPVASVPAPSSLIIFASALFGLMMWRRKSA
jgi:choice-of-anchor A domain-containing protein